MIYLQIVTDNNKNNLNIDVQCEYRLRMFKMDNVFVQTVTSILRTFVNFTLKLGTKKLVLKGVGTE